MVKTRKPATRNAEATQQALLDAAAELFAAVGYEATTLERIAAGAGVTKAMVRYHFRDKAGMYRAMISETLDHIANAILPVRDSDLEPEAKLARYVAAFAEAVRERPHVGALLVTDYAAGRIAKDKALTASLFRFSDTTRAILAEGYRAGAFGKPDPHLFHLWLVGAIALFVSSQRFRDDFADAPPWKGPTPSFERYVRLLQDLAIKGARRDD